MSPEQMLREIDNNDCVAFKVLVEEIGKYGKAAPYCFVEGYDAPYYRNKVEAFSETRPIFIRCGGKKGVVEGYRYISSKPAYSDNYRLLYFVDKDYDNNTSLPCDIFVTDGYSVENYYGSNNAMRNVCEDICHIPKEKDNEILKILEIYDNWKTDFFTSTRPFCAWYFCIKNDSNRCPSKKNYKDSFPSCYASIDKNGIVGKNYSIDTLNLDYSLESPVTYREWNEALNKINTIDDIRGKYVMQLVQEFIEFLRIKWCANNPKVIKPFNFERNNKTILARLSFAADWSPRLRRYIQQRLIDK